MGKQNTIKLQSWCQKDNTIMNWKSKVTFMAIERNIQFGVKKKKKD